MSIQVLAERIFPEKVKKRRAESARPAAQAIAREDNLRANRDALRREMSQHLPILLTVCADYSSLLERELARPASELVRCNCAPRYVTIRRMVQRQGAANYGREYHACPFSGGAGTCRFFQWVV